MKRKPFDELTFADDGMFQAVMKVPEISAELVERLLGVRVKQVEYPELEKAIEPYYTSHGVRLDVYLKDEDKVIDVELQSYPQKELGKRMRYYQSMADCDSLMKGQPYTKLKESYILFICKFDPFHDDALRHHFGQILLHLGGEAAVGCHFHDMGSPASVLILLQADQP